MESDKHFSHDHPLVSTLFEDNEVVDYDVSEKPPKLCRICGLPILSSPSYTCTIRNCNFFMHKPCAHMPEELGNHPCHEPPFHPLVTHPLHLVPVKGRQVFTYKCVSCTFDLHPLLVLPVEIKSKHISHLSHPLMAVCREIMSTCDACGEKQNGFFFCCQQCNFWIHQDCALLPAVVNLSSHIHPYFLSYTLPLNLYHSQKCNICTLKCHWGRIGFYHCLDCYDHAAHLSCVRSKIQEFQTETRLQLIQLPDAKDKFPSLVIRRYLYNNDEGDEEDIDEEDSKLMLESYHEHGLILVDGDGGNSSGCNKSGIQDGCCDIACDICTKSISISSPYYMCQLHSDQDCQFLVHTFCANHLYRFKAATALNNTVTILANLSEVLFGSVFLCMYCHRPSNGLCLKTDSYNLCYFDLECLLAPKVIKHGSHKQHALSQTLLAGMSSIPLSCCNAVESFYGCFYRCIVCNFLIHLGCALLPTRIRHKFDEHPLDLITSTTHQDNQECGRFCEFCEEDINQQYWYYGCVKCEQYLHIKCIPSVGYLSKVKFGKSLDDKSIHRHTLTLTRMLTHGRHERCGYCKRIITGFVDEMAFQCSSCYFWIHFSCAHKKSSSLLISFSVLWQFGIGAILRGVL